MDRYLGVFGNKNNNTRVEQSWHDGHSEAKICWRHNSEVVKTGHEHVAKDLDGSTKEVKNIQGTSPHVTNGDEGSIGGDNAKEKRRGGMSGIVEPRSYRDVLTNGEERKTMT